MTSPVVVQRLLARHTLHARKRRHHVSTECAVALLKSLHPLVQPPHFILRQTTFVSPDLLRSGKFGAAGKTSWVGYEFRRCGTAAELGAHRTATRQTRWLSISRDH